jgi:hypothetical protein
MNCRSGSSLLAAVACATAVATLDAQVTLTPVTAPPGIWERFTLLVANAGDSPLVAIRMEVPLEIVIAGIERRPEWPFTVDSLPGGARIIEWRGGWVATGEFQEFRFMGRLRTDVDADRVSLPVFLERVGGESESWAGGSNPAPRVIVDRTPRFTASGTSMLGVVGIVIGSVALALSIAALFASVRQTSD